MKKLHECLTDAEQAEIVEKIKNNPSFKEVLQQHLSNPLYKEANFDYQRTQVLQIIKGAEKYPNPLNIDNWTAAEFIDHANQEFVDAQHYLTGAKLHFERMEKEINKLRSDVIYWRDKHNIKSQKVATLTHELERLKK